MANSHCCTAETNTLLQSNCLHLKNKLKQINKQKQKNIHEP